MATPNLNDYDKGSILGNLWNDIKHLPERRLQDSRELRVDARRADIQATIQKKLQEESENRRRQQVLMEQLAGAKIAVPYMQDGTTLNETAAFGALGDYNRMQQAIKPYQDTQAREKAQMESEAIQYGLDPKAVPEGGLAQAIAQKKAQISAAEKAKIAREGIAQLSAEFPQAFGGTDVTKMSDEQVLGALPQFQGRAAGLRRDAAETSTQKTVQYKSGISKQIRELAAKKQQFLESGQPVPPEMDAQFSDLADTYNASRKADDAVNPVVAEAMKAYSARPLPAGQTKDIATGITTLGQANRALDDMDNAVKALGGGEKGKQAFASYFGLGQPQVMSLLQKVQMPDEQKSAVLNALQGIEQVRAAARYALYAGNLTENEAKKFDLQAGSPNNVDFLDRSRTFINNTKKKTRDQIKAINDQGYYVPKAITDQLDNDEAPKKKPTLAEIFGQQ